MACQIVRHWCRRCQSCGTHKFMRSRPLAANSQKQVAIEIKFFNGLCVIQDVNIVEAVDSILYGILYRRRTEFVLLEIRHGVMTHNEAERWFRALFCVIFITNMA